jgi:regulation of enolase protein 1 (concanavalin A-like superfamily)
MLAHLVIVALAVAQADWFTLAPEGKNYHVEMPAKPNQTSSRTMSMPDGKAEVTLAQTKVKGVAYALQTLTTKSKFDPKTLDDEVKQFAEGNEAKVVSSKPITVDGNPGREFTLDEPSKQGLIRSKDRIVMSGNTMLMLMVASAPGGPIPDDADRFLTSLKFDDTATAPVSNPSTAKLSSPAPSKTIASWGDVIDPDRDCEIASKGESLVITVPGTLHDLNSEIKKWNAPRVVREVHGDFTATVKVAGNFTPGGKPTNPKSVPYNGAGFVLWLDDATFLRVERAAIVRNGKVSTFLAFEQRAGGKKSNNNGKLAPGTTYLRLTRQGNQISVATSPDSKTWEEAKPMTLAWPADLMLGVSAVNSNSEPLQATFEQFVVEDDPAK